MKNKKQEPSLSGFLEFLKERALMPKSSEGFKVWVQGVVNAAATYEEKVREGADK